MARLYVSNKDESIRLFQNHFLERLTLVHWSTPLVLFVPCTVYLLWLAQKNLTWLGIEVFFVGGIFLWTLTEYILHRFLFHFKPVGPRSEKIIFLFHGIHHDYPCDSRRLVMPPSVSIPLACLFSWLFFHVFGNDAAPAYLAGFFVGYMAYDMIHFAVHHWHTNWKWFAFVKTHHMRHHYGNHDRGYGVSSPLWDVILRSGFKQVVPHKTEPAFSDTPSSLDI